MELEILLPFKVFLRRGDVAEVVAESREGLFALLPRRLDCVAALVPGILTYRVRGEPAIFLAVDEGVLVKTGDRVMVSARQAFGGMDLPQLHAAVKREFMRVDAEEREVRAAVERLEANFIRRLAELDHGR